MATLSVTLHCLSQKCNLVSLPNYLYLIETQNFLKLRLRRRITLKTSGKLILVS